MNYRINIAVIFIITISLAFVGAYFTTLDQVKYDDDTLFIEAESFSPDFTKTKLAEGQEGIYTYEYQLTTQDLDKISGDMYAMIINKLSDHGLAVYIDDQLIYKAGDMERGQANFKYGYFIIPIVKSLVKESSIIRIDTYALYKTGLETDGIIITDGAKAIDIEGQLRFFSTALLYFGIGFLIFAGLFTLIVYFMNHKEDITLFYCGLATFFISVFFMDFMNLHIPFSYLLFKKISLLALFVGGTLYIMAASKFLKLKLIQYIMMVITFVFAGVTLWADTMIIYKSIYDYFYLIFLVIVFLTLILSAMHLGKSDYAYIFFIGFIGCAVFVGFSVITEMLGLPFAMNSPLVYIVVMATMPLLIGIDVILQKREALIAETARSESEYINANTDSLTGVWNQRYLFRKLKSSKDHRILAILDLDDFKIVNDTYGHLAGDEVLKHVTRKITGSISDKMDCCRYGGDEFVILGYDTTYEDMKRTMEKICKAIDKSSITYENNKIHVTVSIGVYQWSEKNSIEEALRYADKALYQSKAQGKNCVW